MYDICNRSASFDGLRRPEEVCERKNCAHLGWVVISPWCMNRGSSPCSATIPLKWKRHKQMKSSNELLNGDTNIVLLCRLDTDWVLHQEHSIVQSYRVTTRWGRDQHTRRRNWQCSSSLWACWPYNNMKYWQYKTIGSHIFFWILFGQYWCSFSIWMWHFHKSLHYGSQ
jgi:hypothetical protein